MLFSLIIECNNGTYGENCTYQCGQCLNSVTCDHVNGKCFGGCKPGWQKTDKCDKRMYIIWRSVLLCFEVAFCFMDFLNGSRFVFVIFSRIRFKYFIINRMYTLRLSYHTRINLCISLI